jgi:thymidylate kinase
MVGIVGGDGAGKSTALAALEGWLGSEFDVRVVHLGKPRWSLTTTTVRGTLKVANQTLAVLPLRNRLASLDRLARGFETHRPLLWLLCTARDRHRAYRSARRFTAAGGLVLCDRYPHPRLVSMETPLIARRAEGKSSSRLLQAMVALEERYHRSIALPELLVVLRVHPEIAVARKVDESPESVRARGTEIWSIDWRAAGAQVVDASQPPEDVARELRTLVWSTIA